MRVYLDVPCLLMMCWNYEEEVSVGHFEGGGQCSPHLEGQLFPMVKKVNVTKHNRAMGYVRLQKKGN